MYTYTWYQWLAFFYVYCFLGWIFESTYVSLKQKRLVNRGFLRLPMLPLYGSGAVMMLWVSLPVRDSLPLVYISGFIAATALEYVTARHGTPIQGPLLGLQQPAVPAARLYLPEFLDRMGISDDPYDRCHP